MLIIAYLAGKLIIYSIWCYVGMRLFRSPRLFAVAYVSPVNSSVTDSPEHSSVTASAKQALGLGFFRLAIGIVFGAITILVDEITALPPAQNRIITRRKREYFDRLRGVLDELKSQGKLHDVDTTAATFSLLGMINWLSRWFRQDGDLTQEQVAEQITRIALNGLLRPESRSTQSVFKVVKKR